MRYPPIYPLVINFGIIQRVRGKKLINVDEVGDELNPMEDRENLCLASC